MATTTLHQRFVKPDASEAGKTASYNGNLDSLEKGYHVRGTAGGAVTQFKAVYYDAGTNRWRHAIDVNSGVRGICQVTAADAALTYTQVQGIVTNASWTWTAGQEIFVHASTAGDLTATTPTDSSRPIGMAISATEILLYRADEYNDVEVIQAATAMVPKGSIVAYHSDTNTGASFSSRTSKGSRVSPTALTNGINVLVVDVYGYDGTAYQRGGYMVWAASETWGGAARGNDVFIARARTGQTTVDNALQIAAAVADGETAILVQRNVAGTFSLVRVSMAPENALPGAGFKSLRVPI